MRPTSASRSSPESPRRSMTTSASSPRTTSSRLIRPAVNATSGLTVHPSARSSQVRARTTASLSRVLSSPPASEATISITQALRRSKPSMTRASRAEERCRLPPAAAAFAAWSTRTVSAPSRSTSSSRSSNESSGSASRDSRSRQVSAFGWRAAVLSVSGLSRWNPWKSSKPSSRHRCRSSAVSMRSATRTTSCSRSRRTVWGSSSSGTWEMSIFTWVTSSSSSMRSVCSQRKSSRATAKP